METTYKQLKNGDTAFLMRNIKTINNDYYAGEQGTVSNVYYGGRCSPTCQIKMDNGKTIQIQIENLHF